MNHHFASCQHWPTVMTAPRGIPRGAVITVGQCWQLAKWWFTGRFDPEWRRLTPEEARQSFEEAGLKGMFWELG